MNHKTTSDDTDAYLRPEEQAAIRNNVIAFMKDHPIDDTKEKSSIEISSLGKVQFYTLIYRRYIVAMILLLFVVLGIGISLYTPSRSNGEYISGSHATTTLTSIGNN